jgi:hypothetical protein
MSGSHWAQRLEWVASGRCLEAAYGQLQPYRDIIESGSTMLSMESDRPTGPKPTIKIYCNKFPSSVV